MPNFSLFTQWNFNRVSIFFVVILFYMPLRSFWCISLLCLWALGGFILKDKKSLSLLKTHFCLRAPVSSDFDVPKLTYHEKNYNWDGSNEKYISLLQLYENRLKIAIRFPSVLDRFLKFVGRAKIRLSFAHFSKKPLHFREI